jgi:lipopolysaccharide transport system permease protein
LIIPLAAVVTALVDFAVSLALLAALMAWYGMAPQASLAFMPLLVILVLLLASGAGLLLSALTVKYRDFRYVVPFLIQIGLFVSPVAFTADAVPERLRTWYSLNPMVGIIDGFRWTILGSRVTPDSSAIAVATIVTALTLLAGTAYFRRTERGFADVV